VKRYDRRLLVPTGQEAMKGSTGSHVLVVTYWSDINHSRRPSNPHLIYTS